MHNHFALAMFIAPTEHTSVGFLWTDPSFGRMGGRSGWKAFDLFPSTEALSG